MPGWNSVFDLYVGDQSVELIDLTGRVNCFQEGDNTAYELTPGGPSIIADANTVSNGEGNVDAQWDDWKAGRDSILARKADESREAAAYLPPQLDSYAYDLHHYGRWERVLYHGEYREFWRPTDVPERWQPFTVGRWTDYYGDQVWAR